MKRHKALLTLVVALPCLLLLTGCPWSKSPNVFDASEGISMPRLSGGPPRQSEPPLEDSSTSLESARRNFD